MNTFQQRGARIPYTNGTGSTISAGALVIVRSGSSGVCGVAINDIANGSSDYLEVGGVHALTAGTGAISYGALVYRNSSTGAITTATTGNTLAGYVVAAKTTAATTAYVLVNGQSN